MKAKVLVGRKLPDAIEARLSRDYDAILNPSDTLYSADDIVVLSDDVDFILACHSEKFDAATINRLSDRVKGIVNFSVGYDHVDTMAAKARGIAVTNTPDVLNDATAETAMLCLLGAARRAGEGYDLVRSGEWKDWSPAFMVGTQITGKRLGIVGMGRVGQTLARRARGFDMKIHYYNRNRLPAELEADATYHSDLNDLLEVSDVLSLHCPNTPETMGLLNAERIAKLPKGAIVVNTARGGIVDDTALTAALERGHVAAAGLDVFNGEPTGIHEAYRRLRNVFVLPHIGSATEDTRHAMGERALSNLDSLAAGREPRDRVA